MRRHHTDFRGKGQRAEAAAGGISAEGRERESWGSLNGRFATIMAGLGQ